MTRLPLGVDLESQRQRMAESLIEEGYTEDYIIDALEEIEPVIHPSLQPETPLQIEQRQAHWERIILEARDRALQRPPVASQLGNEGDFADQTLDQALQAAESSTRAQFQARVYADTRIWEMGHQARRTLADQELAFARVRFERDRSTRTTPGAESSRTAEERALLTGAGDGGDDIVDPTQRTIAERVVQAPRSRTQRSSYVEIDDD